MRSKLALSSIILGSVLAVGIATADDWTQFHGPNRDHRSKETGLAKSWGQGGPPELWSISVGQGFGGASISGDEVYILDREEELRDALRCLSIKTGKEQWRVNFKVPGRLPFNGSRSVPTIGPKRVYSCGPFGHLYVVDRKSHKALWKKNLMNDFNARVPRFGYSHSPLLYKKFVIVAPSSSEVGLVAFDQESGKVKWKSKGFRGQTYQSCVMRTLAGVKMITFQCGSTLVGVDPDSGKTLWTYSGYVNKNPIPDATTVGADQLFLTAGYGAGSVLIKITKAGDSFVVSEKSRISSEGSQIHPAIYYKGHLYSNFNRNRNLRGGESMGLVCLDLKGKILWQTGGTPGFDRGGVLFADGMLICVGGEDGYLRLVAPNPKGYKELAAAPIFQKTLKRRKNEIWCPLALSNGKLIVRNHRVIKCFNLAKGSSSSPKKAGPKKAGPKKRRFK